MKTILQWLIDSHTFNLTIDGWVWVLVVPIGLILLSYIMFVCVVLLFEHILSSVWKGF